MGVIEDQPNRSKLAKLLRFKTSKSGEGYQSLEKYVENKPEWQKGIYYLAGETVEEITKSPFLESAKRKDIEVLYLDDPIDEYVMQNMQDFDGFKLTSLTKEGIKFGDENEEDEKKRIKFYKDTYKPLTTYLKDLFANKVSKVSVSSRVDSVPSVIVTGQFGHTANMERIMRAQTFANPEQFKMMSAQKTLEINPRHPLIHSLLQLVQDDPDAIRTKDLAHVLYDTALMSSGFTMEDTQEFASRQMRTLATSLGVESLDLMPEAEIPEDEEEAALDEADDAEADDFGNDEF
jgi:HSP90 family molecular chaperone